MAEALTDRNFREFEGARRPRRSAEANVAANAVLAELATRAVPRVRELARQLLLFVAEDLFRRYLPPEEGRYWPEDAEFSLWRAVLLGPSTIAPEEADRVRELAAEAGGWWTLPSPAEPPTFLATDDWATRYDDWLRATTKKL